jgi:hypothetical protein
MNLSPRRRIALAVLITGVLLLLGLWWLHTNTPLHRFVSLQTFTIVGILFVAAIAIGAWVWIKLRGTWYRRMAYAIFAMMSGYSLVGFYYIALQQEPPLWVDRWYGPQSPAVVIGGLFCILGFAVLDYRSRFGYPSVTYALGEESPRKPDERNQRRSRFTFRHKLEVEEELEARARYLEEFAREIRDRLGVSLYRERLIDLGIHETPTAPIYAQFRDVSKTREFANIDEALRTFEHRVLILGAPGAGKTTALLKIAEGLCDTAKRDPRAPIPVMVNLSTLRFDSTDSRLEERAPLDRRLADLPDGTLTHGLTAELKRLRSGRRMADRWVRRGRIVALLDGLDEVDDGIRGEFVDVINQTYLRRFPERPIVVCSRIHEYHALRRNDLGLEIQGAVTIDKLSDAQVDRYLQELQAEGLRQSLKDKELRELADTPLTLSVLVIAYDGMAPSNFEGSFSLNDRRKRLWDAYVDKMLQRKAQHDRNPEGVVRSLQPVPVEQYDYSPDFVRRCLGWLAVRMSVRNATDVSMGALYQFLLENRNRDTRSLVNRAIIATHAPVMFLLAVPAVWAVAPVTLLSYAQGLGLALLGVFLVVATAWFAGAPSELAGYRPWMLVSESWTQRLLSHPFRIASWGMGLVALSRLLPTSIPPIALGFIILCLGFLLFRTVRSVVVNDRLRIRGFWALAFGASLVGWAVGPLIEDGLALWTVRVSLLMVAPCLIVLRHGINEIVFFQYWLITLIYIVVGVVLADNFPYVLDWRNVLGVYIVGRVLGCLNPATFLQQFIALSTFVVGGLYHGAIGAAAASLFNFILWSLSFLFGSLMGPSISRMLRMSSQQAVPLQTIERWSERTLFTPILMRVLALLGHFPASPKRFVDFASDALLLHRIGAKTAFMHLLLRDYFALLELQDRIYHPELETRLEAIRYLGYQGEAAIGVLSEFYRDDTDARIRAAAVSAIARIHSDDIQQTLLAAFADIDPLVRAEAALNIESIPSEKRRDLLKPLLDDEHAEVQHAVIRAIISERIVPMDASSDELNYKELHEFLMKKLQLSAIVRQSLYDLVVDSSDSQLQQRAIVWSRSLGDSSAVKAYASVIVDSKSQWRNAAVDGLGELKDNRAIPPLIKALSDMKLSIDARRALLDIGTPEAATAIEQWDAARRRRVSWWRRWLRRLLRNAPESSPE